MVGQNCAPYISDIINSSNVALTTSHIGYPDLFPWPRSFFMGVNRSVKSYPPNKGRGSLNSVQIIWTMLCRVFNIYNMGGSGTCYHFIMTNSGKFETISYNWGTQLWYWKKGTVPTSDAPNATRSLRSVLSMTDTPQCSFADGERSKNAADWWKKSQGRLHIWSRVDHNNFPFLKMPWKDPVGIIWWLHSGGFQPQ